jgi:hypothetical protein
MKGVVSVRGSVWKFVFQGIHMLFEGVQSDEKWRDEEMRGNRVIFIGRKLDRKELTEGVRGCLWEENSGEKISGEEISGGKDSDLGDSDLGDAGSSRGGSKGAEELPDQNVQHKIDTNLDLGDDGEIEF